MPKKFSAEVKRQVIEAVQQAPDMTYADIGTVFGVSQPIVQLWAKEAGIARRHRKPVSTQATEPDELDSAIEKTQQQLADLLRFKEETAIRFERDGSRISVYGLGTQPLVAEVKHWLRFLRREGAAQLRKFIDDNFGTPTQKLRVQ